MLPVLSRPINSRWAGVRGIVVRGWDLERRRGRREVTILNMNNARNVHEKICKPNATRGECLIYRTTPSNVSLHINTDLMTDNNYPSSSLCEIHHIEYSKTALTTSLFNSSSPNINFLASMFIPFKAGWVHLPPTLGASGARATPSVAVPALNVWLWKDEGVWVVLDCRWGVAKIGAGGTRCICEGGVYGLWNPAKLPPILQEYERILYNSGCYQLVDAAVSQMSLSRVRQSLSVQGAERSIECWNQSADLLSLVSLLEILFFGEGDWRTTSPSLVRNVDWRFDNFMRENPYPIHNI